MLARFRFKYGPSLVRGTNMEKVELLDNLRSVSTLQSDNIPELEAKSSTSTGNMKLTILETIDSRDQTYRWQRTRYENAANAA